MSDLARFLPLSNRPRRDETGTTRDWAARVAEVAASVERAAEAVGPAAANNDGIRDGIEAVRAHARDAAARHAAGKRVRIRALRATLRDAWRAADALGVDLEVDPVVTGAVALDLAAGARLPIRAVIRDRTLVASDHGWRLGTGPELVGTARRLIEFLAGDGPVPTP